MSGFLDTVGALATGNFTELEPWFQALRQASFRGVPFLVRSHESSGHARRVPVHEFILRDAPATEDIGGQVRVYNLRAYLLGPTYNINRDQLILACRSPAGPGTLVHPYYGELVVRCTGCRVRETEQTGRYCELELQFTESGTNEPIPATLNTAGALVLAVEQLRSVIGLAFTAAYIISTHPNVLTGLAVGLMAPIADLFLGGLALSVDGTAAVAASGIGVFATGADPTVAAESAADGATIAAAVTGAAEAAANDLADTALASPPATPGAADAGNLIAGVVGTVVPAGDWTGGLGQLASYGASIPPVLPGTPTRAQAAINQDAILELARGAATAGILAVLAARTWATAAEATAARQLVIGLVDARSDAAAAAFDDPRYLAWTGALAGAMDDLDARVAALPVLGTYTTPLGLPSLALAQRLYRDASRADELRALNNVRRPMFMPVAGQALSS